jgi:heme oxygenase
MSRDLALQLREGTKQSHTMAENTAFMKCFTKGIVERTFFRELLADLYFVYSTLEREFQGHREHPIAGTMYFPELDRTANLEKDLAFYYGDNWRSEIAPSPAGQQYVARIEEISATNPELLIAHAYVRYLGDLSGGQALKNIVRSGLKLTGSEGTAFYEFDAIPTVEAKRDCKERYRLALDALNLDETAIANIVAEANLAFQFNRDILHELEPEVKAAVGDHVFDLLVRQDKPGSTERPLAGVG